MTKVVVPALALRGLTIFPRAPLHFDVGRPQSIQAVEEAMDSGSAKITDGGIPKTNGLM